MNDDQVHPHNVEQVIDQLREKVSQVKHEVEKCVVGQRETV
jgi:hypothetical protein